LVAAGTTTGCVVLFGPHGQQRWLRTLDEEHAIVALHFVHHSLIAIAADSTLRVWSLDKIHGGTTYTDVFDVLAACTFTMTLSPNDDEEFPDRTFVFIWQITLFHLHIC
jgi:WD40 repeat protein